MGSLNIYGKITGIKYSVTNLSKLTEYKFEEFNINNCRSSCIVKYGNLVFGLSKWVSPKRTRSYPFERVYNTLKTEKKVTVIPIIKDEGRSGDRDFLQWDTIALMSLLNVYVIPGVYVNVSKNKRNLYKVTEHQFDNEYINRKLLELSKYCSSALHWNLNEIEKSFEFLIETAIKTHKEIENKFNIKLHSVDGLSSYKDHFTKGVNEFKDFSRSKAKLAQNRESETIQPKESLNTSTKAKLTIENYLGGFYYLTTDEVRIDGENIHLIEAKHSKSSILPAISDIKDGLLKMVLYCNLEKVTIAESTLIARPRLLLTSEKLNGAIDSTDTEATQSKFFKLNKLNSKNIQIISSLFHEALENNFVVEIKGVR
ncbi:MAG: hypothetical protein L6Q59_06840 [Ignavibacteriaceae bacterium]|nr:hypothetical protein [Ignavibacteriaceae bacterium]